MRTATRRALDWRLRLDLDGFDLAILAVAAAGLLCVAASLGGAWL